MSDNSHSEFLRKLVHASGVVFLPLLYREPLIFSGIFAFLLILYVGVEKASRRGVRVVFLSSLIARCKRPEERGRPAPGPIFLAVSCIVTPLLFGPAPAALGLGQAFLADTAASLAGSRWGKKKIPYSPRKSWVGFFVFWVLASVIGLLFLPLVQAILVGFLGAFVESLPLKEKDNLTVPLAVSAAGSFFRL